MNLYLGLFLKSLTTLLLELSLVRVISISKWSHYAYLVVSMALLGFGASGTFLTFLPQNIKKKCEDHLDLVTLLMALSMVAVFYWSNRIPLDPAKLAWDPWQLFYLINFYLVLSLPFFFSGLVSSLVFSRHSEKSHQLYFADLFGAAMGCLPGVYLFLFVPPQEVVAIAGMIGLASAWCFSRKKHLLRTGLVVALVVVISYQIIIKSDILTISMSPFKALSQSLRFPQAQILATRWNAHSRVDIFQSAAVHFAPGLSLVYQQNLPPQLGLTIDGDNLNAVTKWESLEATGAFTAYLPSSLVYKVRPQASVLVLNSGGGLNLLEAIYHQAERIEAIEPNEDIISLLQGPFREFSGDIYGQPSVNYHTEEIRSHLGRSDKRYDVIQMSLSTNPSAASTGLHSLNENYAFTVEAFEEYLKHLTRNGIFTLTRYLLPPPREDVRFITLARAALQKMNIKDNFENIFLFRSWGTITLLLKREPFISGEISTLKKAVADLRFDLVYYPGIKVEETNRFNRFKNPLYFQIVQDLLFHPQEVRQNYPYDLSPVYDDNPYYFHFFRWDKIVEVYRLLDSRWQGFLEGGYLLVFMLGQATVGAFFIIVAPLFLRHGAALRSFDGKMNCIFYFAALGLAFMFVELSLIQKFILILEHPIMAFSLILFALLISSGLGSFFSGTAWVQKRILIGGNGFLAPVALFILFLLLIVYGFTSSYLSLAISGYSLIARKALSVLVVFPIGFFMGIPFPTALKSMGMENSQIIPWAWAINGANSVVGSILASQLALGLGFSGVIIVAALLYALAILAFLRMRHS